MSYIPDELQLISIQTSGGVHIQHHSLTDKNGTSIAVMQIGDTFSPTYYIIIDEREDNHFIVDNSREVQSYFKQRPIYLSNPKNKLLCPLPNSDHQ